MGRQLIVVHGRGFRIAVASLGRPIDTSSDVLAVVRSGAIVAQGAARAGCITSVTLEADHAALSERALGPHR